MATEKRIYSDLAIPPGDYLSEVLTVKGMTQAELARRIGRPTQAVNEIIKGAKAITPTTALQLERALGVPAHIWTGLESRYQIIKARQEERAQLRSELPHLKSIPYKQLADLGCVDKAGDKEHKIGELQRFYGVSSLEHLSGIRAYEASFRCGGARDPSNYALAAWMRCAELKADEEPADAFDRGKLLRSLGNLRALSTKDPVEFMPELKSILAGCGVVLVMLPHFPKTYAHGATFWARPEKAVLAMSIRGKWADIFWFSLFHELGHILLHKKRTFIDDRRVSPETAREEKAADDFAERSLIEAELFDPFVRKADFSEAAVKALAGEAGVSVGIVIGRLQHKGLLPQNSELNRLRERYDPFADATPP
ncbi:MAG: HigA family addiction module antitoxin [Candidatus Aminicenantes bacterium]|nr:HigA family addiction module antitoxin [Candidatus Aminicenantes bacterium]